MADPPASAHLSPPPILRGLALLAALLAAATIFALSCFELSSVDIGYHLAYGRRLVDTGRIVDVDPFIYAVRDHHFVNANWGAQAVMAAVERRAGADGLIALRITLIGLSFAFATAALRRAAVPWPWIPPAWLLAAFAAYERFSMRPELFSSACLIALLWLLISAPRPGIALPLAAVIQCVWTNTHSYFVVGPILTAAWLAGAALARHGSSTPDAPAAARPSALAAVLLVQLLACAANPRGLEGALFPLKTLTFLRDSAVSTAGPEASPESPWAAISEFHPPHRYLGFFINRRTIHAWVACLGLCLVGIVAAARTRLYGPATAMVLLLLMSLQMRRNIAQFALAAVPLAVIVLVAWLRRWPVAHTTRHRIAAAALLISAGLAVWWLPRIVSGRFYFDERRVNRVFGRGWHDPFVPRAACGWLNAHPEIRPRLFADFSIASNVLPFLRPDLRSVFVDTNTFAYPPQALGAMHDVCLARVDHAAFFDGYEVNVVLLRADESTKRLIGRLAADPNWALVWFDGYTVVFLRQSPDHAALIQSTPITPASLDRDDWIARANRPHVVPALDLLVRAGVPLSLGWYEQSAALLSHAVELEPALFEAWLNLGVSHANLANAAIRRGDAPDSIVNRLNAAIQCFETVLRLDPGNPIAVLNLDRARRSLGPPR